jgi:integrase
MKRIVEVAHKGIAIKIKEGSTTVGGVKYTTWTIRDYSSGKLVRLKRSSLEEAKATARAIAEVRVSGENDSIPLSGLKREVQTAIRLLEPNGAALDDAARVYAECIKLVPPDEIVEACRFWRDNKPNGRFTPKKVKDGVDQFLAEKRFKRRYKTNASYLNALRREFGERDMHTVSSGDLETFVNLKVWKPKTYNDFLGLISLFYKWAIKRGYASVNPASAEAIERKDREGGDIGIFTPEQLRKMLTDVDDDLKPLLALWSFTGLRQAEIARLTWEELGPALTSRTLFFPKSKSKNRLRDRLIPIRPALRPWLIKYRQASGPVLPENWQGEERLSELARTIARQTKVVWKPNGPRHSFATYMLALEKDAPVLVREMDNSLRQLESHYWARSDSITKQQATDWFSIVPDVLVAVLKLHDVVPEPADARSSA